MSMPCHIKSHSHTRISHLVLWLLAGLMAATNAWSTTSVPQQINFVNILQDKDIAIGEIEAVLQDNIGYIWLGGRNGLLRYNGYDFLPLYIYDDNDEAKPPSYVIDLFEDSRNRLWVSTSAGLAYYDRKQQRLRLAKTHPNSKAQLPGAVITRIIEVHDDELWLASISGLYIYRPSTEMLTIISPNASQALTDAPPITIAPVFDMLKDKKGDIWIAGQKGLNRLRVSDLNMTTFIPNPSQPDSRPDNEILAIKMDTHGNIWAGVSNGLYHFNPQTQIFKHFRHDPNDEFSLGGNNIRDILVDSKGLIWISTDGGGLNLYDEDNARFIRFKHRPGQAGSLASNSTRGVYEDRNGDLWVGTYPSGMNFYDRSSSAISHYSHDPNNPNSLPHNSVLSISEDNKGNLWIGTDGGGVTYFDRFNNTFSHYQVENGKISSNAILGTFIDSKGLVWAGTWGGAVNRFNPQSDRFEQIPFDANLKGKGPGQYSAINDEAVWTINEDPQGNIWIGTHGGGLNKYNPKTQRVDVYMSVQGEPDRLSGNLVWTTFEDSKGNFWVGTSNGLNLFDPHTATTTRIFRADGAAGSLSNGSVLSIFEDKSGRLWFGTDWGLNLYAPQTQTFTAYSESAGFIDSGIRSISADDDGYLWLGTNKGIVRFHPDTEEVTNYKRAGGRFLGGFNTNSSLFSAAGEIILGGTNGMRIFKIEALGINKTVPPITLSNFKVFTRPVEINGADGLLTRDINETTSITLDYKKNMFSFAFSALNFRDPAKNQYAYKLEGFDSEWRQVGSQRSALYTNLDAGVYTFRIRGSNNDGVWNKKGKSIEIIQLPPPWQTLWAYTLYCLVVLGILANFVYKQHKKRKLIEEQNRILEAKVAERTSELAAKNNDIQAMLSNMRQGLFTVETSGNIHPEYSAYLEEVFATTDIAGRNAVELLFTGAKIGADELNQTKERINCIIGEDEMNFTFNAEGLPDNYEVEREGQRQYLSLSWDPILGQEDGEDVVIKLMVSVRDVTELREAEAQAEGKTRELTIISQLLKVPSSKYLAFEASTARFVAENREKIKQCAAHDLDVIALLFRNMHTIKGNCRTYDFGFFSDVVHEVESTYSTLKASAQKTWDAQELLNDLVRVEAIAQEYNNVFHEVLGRESDTSASDALLDLKTIETIQRFIGQVVTKHPSAGKSTELQSANILLNIALSKPLSEVLVDIVDSLPSIAKQLGKELPYVIFTDSNLRVKISAHELLNNVFAHILRNSVDHGIEQPQERIAAGKEAAGTINIHSCQDNGKLCLRVRDDGKGINIERLHETGVKLGHWQATDTPDTADIAELIFASGASTKETVTDISGRGVGMDAVKQFLLNAGGDITLNLLSEKTPDNAFVRFETVITLPEKCFVEIKLEA
ncbi:MAG: hypothetical protein COA42_17415 [Alteromonadaceae bacterium]|nr:MAG: hypothetical protein COA42_17415 [Alteromonadaceae bacterium]